MIDIHRRSLVRREVWFDEPWDRTGADLAVLYHWKEPVYPASAREVHSLEVDLTLDSASIWRGFDATARNLIRRAMREGFAYHAWAKQPREIVDEFFAFQHAFSLERGMGPVTPVWMYEYATQNALLLTRALAPDGKTLVWHSYARVAGWVRQLHSISLAGAQSPEERQLTGKANRYLHWMDMLECQKLGIERFDFGGWYSGGSDEKLLRINRFKEQFGGRKTLRYHAATAVSLRGSLYLKARQYVMRQTEPLHYV